MTANLGIVNGVTRVNDLSGVTDPVAARANLGVSRWQVDRGTGNVGLPNFAPSSQGTLTADATGRVRAQLTPILDPIRVTAAHVVISTAGGAGTLSRLGIYRVQMPRLTNLAPAANGAVTGDLVADFGTVAVSSQGQKDATLSSSLILPPGLYMLLAVSDASTVTYGCQFGVTPVFVHRATPVANNWRSFGVFWGSTANDSGLVSTGFLSTLSAVSDSNTGSSLGGSLNAQFIFLSWSAP